MILLNSGKLSVDGVDVYPDHDVNNKTQFWYVPSTLKLAERNKRKVLSYFWYTDSVRDTDGTGFLNFEVNTAVSADTLSKIRAELSRRHTIPLADVKLSTVDYKTGRVSFSVLGPMATTSVENAEAAAALRKDPSVVYQSKEQLVWTAGSSSLVGDNAAVCSVKLTKEGKLAGAMYKAVLGDTSNIQKANSIAAAYYLEFLAMRPAITFKVEGTLTKTVDLFKAAIDVENIPLEVLLLDVGLQAAWTRVMSNTDLKITVVNFGGDDKEAGLDWAKQLVLDYVLKHFFEVEIDGKWSSLDDAPEVKSAVNAAKDIEKEAEEDEDEDGDDDDKEPGTPPKTETPPKGETPPKSEPPPKSETPPKGTPPKMSNGVKSAVAAANIPIPKVKVKISYERKEQFNTINFLYTEMKATTVPVAPQALVLEGLQTPKDHIFEVNRSNIPFGLTFPVRVALPTDEARSETGLSAMNLQARYTNGSGGEALAPPQSIGLSNGTTTGPNPMMFQMDATGRHTIDYNVEYVFDAGQNWNTNKFSYSVKGSTDTGVIAAQPQAFLEFLKIDAVVPAEFVWGTDIDRAIITLRSDRWASPRTLVFQKGAPHARQSLRVRGERMDTPTAVEYSVELQKGGKKVFSYGPEPVLDNLITLRDRFVSHVPVYFEEGFAHGVTSVIAQLAYEDKEHNYRWTNRLKVDAGSSLVASVPTVREYADPTELELKCTYSSKGQKPFTVTLKGQDTVFVTGVPE